MPLLLAALISILSLTAHAASPREEIIPPGTDERAGSSANFDRSAAPRAELLGQVRLGNRPHRLALANGICGRRGEQVEAIRLRVLGNAALLGEVTVGNGEGAHRTLKIRRHFLPNSESPWLFLPAQACLKSLSVVGQNAYLSPQAAVVQVFALVGEARRAPKQPVAKRTWPRVRLSQAR